MFKNWVYLRLIIILSLMILLNSVLPQYCYALTFPSKSSKDQGINERELAINAISNDVDRGFVGLRLQQKELTRKGVIEPLNSLGNKGMQDLARDSKGTKIMGREGDSGWEIERVRWGPVLAVAAMCYVIYSEEIAGQGLDIGNVLSIGLFLAILWGMFQPPD